MLRLIGSASHEANSSTSNSDRVGTTHLREDGEGWILSLGWLTPRGCGQSLQVALRPAYVPSNTTCGRQLGSFVLPVLSVPPGGPITLMQRRPQYSVGCLVVDNAILRGVLDRFVAVQELAQPVPTPTRLVGDSLGSSLCALPREQPHTCGTKGTPVWVSGIRGVPLALGSQGI